jgi:thiamine biosynthesis lipoprotein
MAAEIKRCRHTVAAVLLLLVLCGCGNRAEPAEHSFFALDTYITMQASGPNAQLALEEVEEQIKAREQQWSVTSPGSEIYAVNHSSGKPVTVSADTVQLIDFALEQARQTGAALDLTIYPVLTAWGFTTGSYQVPTQAALDKLLALVDYRCVHLEDNTVTIPDGAQIDLGSVAKGFIGDEAADLLRERGITSALINLGGNVQAVGAKPDGSPWRIGVRNPFAEGNLGVLEIEDMAVVTSGGYERYFTDDAGNVYWHILDPQTGHPAKSGLASVTVAAPEGKRCDALSTALFVMGAEQAAEYWQSCGDFEMLLVLENGSIWITEGLEKAFTLSNGEKGRGVTVIRHEA